MNIFSQSLFSVPYVRKIQENVGGMISFLISDLFLSCQTLELKNTCWNDILYK